MLKFFFWSLLCINAVLFAYGQGYLGNFKGNEREPARMKNQLNADKFKLIAPVKAAALPLPAPVAKPVLVACTEVGDFTSAEAKSFEAKLSALALGARQSRISVAPAVTSHIVYIPSQGSKEGAEKKAGELKNLGVSDFFILSDSATMKWGISLGVFKSEAAAQTLLTALNKQGVHSARITGRPSSASKLAYQLRELDADARASVEALVAALPSQELRNCK